MYFKLIANDIKNSRLISTTVVVFILAAAMLMAAAACPGHEGWRNSKRNSI